MLNIATGCSKNTLSCSELNGEHSGEGFISLRHILTPLWACKAKKCHFSRKFDLWPDLTRSNIDLGPKTICAIARSRRGASTGFFREALRPSGADRQGGGRTNPPPDRPRYEKCPDRARVNPIAGGLQVARFPAGWGFRSPTLLTRLPDMVAKKRRKKFDISCKVLSKLSGSFFAKVKIEVTRGHQMSKSF